MIQAYSENIVLTTPFVVPFNNVSKLKGRTTILTAPATFEFDDCGVYVAHVDASVSGAGEVTFQLYQNGVALPEAQATVTLTADNLQNISFKTLITVSRNNTRCCCTSPTLLQLRGTTTADAPVEVTFRNVNIAVTKLC